MKNEDLEKLDAEINEILIEKNEKYKNSFADSLDEFGLIAYIIRVQDKLNRLKYLIENEEEMAHGESVRDTLLDILGYSKNVNVWYDCDSKNNSWENFITNLCAVGKVLKEKEEKEKITYNNLMRYFEKYRTKLYFNEKLKNKVEYHFDNTTKHDFYLLIIVENDLLLSVTFTEKEESVFIRNYTNYSACIVNFKNMSLMENYVHKVIGNRLKEMKESEEQ